MIPLMRVKECLCDTTDACPHVHVHVCDQKFQFLCIGQFLSNC